MLSEIISAVIAIVLAALSVFFPKWSAELYIIYFLFIAFFYVISICIRLYLKNKKLKKELRNISEKHRAVSSSFDVKRNLVAQYRAGFKSLEYMIVSTTTSSRQDRFLLLQQWFLELKSRIEDNEP